MKRFATLLGLALSIAAAAAGTGAAAGMRQVQSIELGPGCAGGMDRTVLTGNVVDHTTQAADGSWNQELHAEGTVVAYDEASGTPVVSFVGHGVASAGTIFNARTGQIQVNHFVTDVFGTLTGGRGELRMRIVGQYTTRPDGTMIVTRQSTTCS